MSDSGAAGVADIDARIDIAGIAIDRRRMEVRAVDEIEAALLEAEVEPAGAAKEAGYGEPSHDRIASIARGISDRRYNCS